MRFTLSFNGLTWGLSPQEGEFAGLLVATADGATLTDVTFSVGVLTGRIQATWGLLALDDGVFNSRHMVKALGIGQVFRSPAALPFHLDGYKYYCTETDKPLHYAAHVMLLNQGKFYGR